MLMSEKMALYNQLRKIEDKICNNNIKLTTTKINYVNLCNMQNSVKVSHTNILSRRFLIYIS